MPATIRIAWPNRPRFNTEPVIHDGPGLARTASVEEVPDSRRPNAVRFPHRLSSPAYATAPSQANCIKIIPNDGGPPQFDLAFVYLDNKI